MASEMADLIRRQGGTPLSAPAMREVPLPERRDVLEAVDGVSEDRFQMVVFLTGVGARAFLAAADAHGKKAEVLAGLGKAMVVCRGPKPLAVCRQNGIPVYLVAPEPNTSEDLLAALQEKGAPQRGAPVLLQHYGVANHAFRHGLDRMGAQVTDISLYAWDFPTDVEPVRRAIDTMVSGGADALLLTSQQQARNLFALAERFGSSAALRRVLAETVVVGSVGPVVTRTLAQYGVEPDVVPEHPKMGILVRALGEYFDQRAGAR